MSSTASPPAAAPPSRSRHFLSAFTMRRVVIALVLSVVVAAALNPVYTTPFLVLLGRMLVIAMLLLLAFTLAGIWKPPFIPGWLAQVFSVVLVAPLATFLVYLPSIGLYTDPMKHEGFVLGYTMITGAALMIGPLLALVALYRERDAQARTQAIGFRLERSTLEKQALDARLTLLHAQIEPHFLFNTLANIQELVESGSPRAAPVLKSLIDYLRAAVPKLHAGEATLGAEAEMARAYLELMHMRMPDRLEFSIEVSESVRSIRFPQMALLTLIENAVRHGIDPGERGGRIDIRADRDAASGRVRVVVADTGVGMDETAVPGTGLRNLRDRLHGFFGPDAELALHEQAPHGLRAEILFRPADEATR
jgi:signal transduction histidine kinase